MDKTPVPIDQDDDATWLQLRQRLREIRTWAEEALAQDGRAADAVLAMLDQPRERWTTRHARST